MLIYVSTALGRNDILHMYDLASSLVSLVSPAPSLTEEGAGDARLLVPCRHFGCMDGGRSQG